MNANAIAIAKANAKTCMFIIKAKAFMLIITRSCHVLTIILTLLRGMIPTLTSMSFLAPRWPRERVRVWGREWDESQRLGCYERGVGMAYA